MKPNFRFLILPAITVLFMGTWSARAEDTPRSAMRKGLKACRAEDYTNAVALLEKTLPEFPDAGSYNLGIAHYRNGNFEAAQKAFNDALRTPDLALQAKAYFNLGNAMLARTTNLPGQDQIGRAAELAFQATDRYEKAILLVPDDLDAKQNYEKARNLWIHLEYTKGKYLFDHAESLLLQYKAKEAKRFYELAAQQFEHILADVAPNHGEASQYLPKTAERLEMLRLAVETAEHDLVVSIQLIGDYQYMLAAQRLTSETDERKYAFDLKPDLKKEYEKTARKNGEVLQIIQDLSNLNIVE